MTETAAPNARGRGEWTPHVLQIIANFRNDTAENKRDAIELIREDFGADAAAYATRGLFPAPAPVKADTPADAPQLDAAAEALRRAHAERVAKDAAKLTADAEFKKQERALTEIGESVLKPDAPYETAGIYIQRECMHDGRRILWHWQDQFYRWGGRVYEVVPDKVMEQQLYEFLDRARKRGPDGPVRFNPTPKNVSDVMHGLRARCALGLECQPPMWLEARESATDWVVFRNAVVNVLTEETRPLGPDLWVHSALGFDWNAEALCPVWMNFLGEVFPGATDDAVDEESVQFLEEWMGYCMTEETKFQKAALLIGPKRSGKSTISHVLRQLVGNPNYVGLSFNTWIYSENSKEVLIGKRVGVFADVRFKPGKSYGANYDPGGITHQSAEFLLNITGRDSVTIGRKYKGAWQGMLPIKLMVISNEVPNLNDASGVLPTRFIKLNFPVSFFGREDVNLSAKLERELSGIAVRCVRAYGDLCDRGEFIQPRSAEVLEREVLEASDPFTAMVQACFAVDFEGTAVRFAMVDAAQGWLKALGRPDEAARVRVNNIVARIRGVAGFEHVGDAPRPHGQPRSVSGLRLIPKNERKE